MDKNFNMTPIEEIITTIAFMLITALFILAAWFDPDIIKLTDNQSKRAERELEEFRDKLNP